MSVDVAQNSVDNLKDDLVIFIDKIAATQVATVPLNWKRILIDNKIVYITPSQQILRSISDVSTYLLSEGTCKCNLACPFFLEFFNFDPQIESVENAIDETKSSCRHRQPNDDYHSAQMYESSPTSSNLIYHQPKVIYTPTIQQATTSHDSTTPTRKIIVQNQAMTGENGRTANYQIQSVLNFKQAEQTNQSGQQQIYGYIQVEKDSNSKQTEFWFILI